MANSPVLWGQNSIANNLQNAELRADGTLSKYNGPKNYISYNNFENALTTGWSLGTAGALTNNIPSGTPTFGSGASGNLSITTVSSGQIAGNTSLSLVSSAATTSGDMLATQTYSIDSADQAKVLGFKFSYSVFSGSGNFSGTSSNSFGVAVWDVTNNAWLGLAGNFSMTQSTGVGIASGTFQTAATTASIRFVIYNANATSGAITLYLDDFFVGPQVTMQAPAVGNTTAYTPTYVGIGTPSNVNVYYWRVGDRLYVNGMTQTGTVTGSTFSVTLPAGLSIDYTKITALNSVQQIGELSFINGTNVGAYPTTSFGPWVMFADGSTTGSVFVAKDNSSTLFSKATGSGIFGNSTYLTFSFNVPIVGWASNAVASSDTDTRVIAANAVGATATVTSTYSDVTWVTINADSSGSFNATSNATTYTIPVSGYYTFAGQIYASATTIAAGQSWVTGLFNVTTSTTVLEVQSIYTGNNTVSRSQPFSFTELFFNAGTQLKIQVKASSTAPVVTASSIVNYIGISRRSGPAVITATESVNARYFSSSTSISGSLATVAYSTKGWDTHNAYNSTTGIYTAPTSGKYQINASISISGTFVLNNTVDLQVQQTGSASQISEAQVYAFASATAVTTNVGDIFYLQAGDTIKVQVSSSGTTPTIAGSTTRNWFSIARVGN